MTVPETKETDQSLIVTSMLGTSTHSCGTISDSSEGRTVVLFPQCITFRKP